MKNSINSHFDFLYFVDNQIRKHVDLNLSKWFKKVLHFLLEPVAVNVSVQDAIE